MFTINYKGFHVHCYFDKPEVSVNGQIYKSMHAAKCAITAKLIPAHDAAMTLAFKG